MSKVHPTACVEAGVRLGSGTSVWQNAHVRHDSVIGDECIIGGNAYVAYGVRIGNRCKVQSFTYICHGVTLEDGVFVGAGAVFTNDRVPRATTPDLEELLPSSPNEETLESTIHRGATIGARAVIGPGVDIGRFAMVGMGAVVTRDVGDFEIVIGNPARCVGAVCRCGKVLARWSQNERPEESPVRCDCGLAYRFGESICETPQLAPAGETGNGPGDE